MSYKIQINWNGVSVKTSLSHSEIIAYTEKIIQAKDWTDCLLNRGRAKAILDAMVILEDHLLKLYERGLSKIRPLTIRYDFDELWAYLYFTTRAN